MSRLASCGFELAWNTTSPEAIAFSSLAIGPGRINVNGNGKAYTLQRLTTSVNPGAIGWRVRFYNGLTKTKFYARAYIRVRALPGANGLRVFGVTGNLEGTDDAVFATVESSGVLSFWNKGNGTKTPIGSTTALSLNRWYRLAVTPRFNSVADVVVVNGCGAGVNRTDASEGDIGVDLYDDTGALVFSTLAGGPFSTNRAGSYCAPSAPITAAGLDTIQASLQVTFGPRSNVVQTETDGGIVDLDDASVDDAVMPGPGFVTMTIPVTSGFYQGFSGSNDWRNVAQQPPSQASTTPGAVTNATLSATISFALQALAELGVTGALKAVNVAVFAQPARTNYKLLFRRNSVDLLSAALTSGVGVNAYVVVAGNTLSTTAGWYIPIAGAATDVLEVGFVDGPTGAGTSAISAVALIVDHESVDPPAAVVPPSGNIQIFRGRYTGNGGVQDIALPFKATFLLIKPDGRKGAVWADGFGTLGAWANNASSENTPNHGIARVYPTGFTVVESANTHVNELGTVTRFIALSDPARRMLETGVVQPNPGDSGTADNFDVALTRASFPIEGLFTWGQNLTAAATQKCFYRGPAQTGDAASPIDADLAEAADAIQSFGTSTFQLGRQATTTNITLVVWAALRTAGVFNGASALLQVGSYVGDGAGGSRVITFATPLAGAGLVIVIPATNGERQYRWGDQTDGVSYAWVAGTARATGAISAFSASGFSVRNSAPDLNVAAVRYNYIAFAGADVTITDLAEAPAPTSSTIGLTWVELIDAVSNLHVWSKIALPDPLSYYGGYKEDRVTKWGLIQRALSDRVGRYESSDFSWECSDTDRALRALLANVSTQYLLDRPITVRMISDADRRLQKTPITVFKGIIRGYQPGAGLLFRWEAQDAFANKFNSQNDADQIPKRLITVADFPNALTTPDPNFPNVPVAVGRPVPILYGEITDTQLVSGLVATTNQLVLDPTIPAPVLASVQRVTGVIADPVTVYVAITAIKAGKEGPFSNVGILRAAQGGAPTTFGVRVNWNAVPGVDSYRIYFADAPDVVPYKTNGSATRLLYVTHDNSTVDGFNPPSYQVTLSDPAAGGVVDLLGGSAAALIDAGVGQTPLIYVGAYTLPDGALPNAGTSTVAVAPSPPLSGTSLDVVAVPGVNPTLPCYAVIYPAGTTPTPANAEIVLLTAIVGQTLTMTRAQKSSTARTILVGDVITIGNPGGTWRKFLICGHALKDITEVYANNKPLGIKGSYFTDRTATGATFNAPADFGYPNWIDLVVPFTPSWFAMFGATAAPYEDINGNRYTVLYVKVNDIGAERTAGFAEPFENTIPGAISVQGIESVGDSTGTLITDGLLIYRHCLQNWIFGSYRSGAWLNSPTFEDDASLSKIDDASFDVCSAIAKTRIAGGYVGAAIIGWSAFTGSELAGGERVSVADLVQRLNLSTDADNAFNRKGQFFVSMEHETGAALTSSRSLNDVDDVIEGSLEIVDKFDEAFNRQPYQHTQDYFGRDTRGWKFVDAAKDDAGIARNGGQPKNAPEVSFYFIRGQNKASDYSGYAQGTLTATDISGRRLRRMKNPPRYATFKISLQGLNFELGDIVRLTAFEGIGANGWLNEGLRVVRFVISIDDYTVEVTAYDIQLLYSFATFILGDRTVLPGGGWTAATDAQRLYGFLGDRPSLKFSNGDPIKRLG